MSALNLRASVEFIFHSRRWFQDGAAHPFFEFQSSIGNSGNDQMVLHDFFVQGFKSCSLRM